MKDDKKQKGYLLEKDGSHYFYSYSRKVNDTKLVLKYAKIGAWVPKFKGQEVIRLADDGNGVTVFHRGKPTTRLDYLEIWELYNALHKFFSLEDKKPLRSTRSGK